MLGAILLGLVGVVRGAPLPDVQFDQIISHQSVYASEVISPAQDVLPFSAPVIDAMYDANGFCFVAITGDGLMWSSRRKMHAPDQDPLDRPYHDWKKVADFSTLMRANDDICFVKLPDSIAIATSAHIVEVVMDFTCSELVSQQERSETTVHEWGHVSSITSDSSGLWMGTASGLFYADSRAVSSPESPGAWKLHPVLDVPPNVTVSTLLWAPPWGVMFAGTTNVLYELRFSVPATADAVIMHKYVVRQEWIEGNLDYSIGE